MIAGIDGESRPEKRWKFGEKFEELWIKSDARFQLLNIILCRIFEITRTKNDHGLVVSIVSKLFSKKAKGLLKSLVGANSKNPVTIEIDRAFRSKGFAKSYADTFAAWYVAKNASLAGVVQDEVPNRDSTRSELSCRATTFTTNQRFSAGSVVTGTSKTALSAFIWVNPSTLAGDKSIIGEFNTTAQRGWFIQFDGTSLRVIVSADGGIVNAKSYVTTATFSTGTWYHVGFAFAAGVLTVYINGKSAAVTKTVDGTVSTIHDSVQELEIASMDGGANYFEGRIAHPAIWESALTPAQVRDHYLGKWDQIPTPDHAWNLQGSTAWTIAGSSVLSPSNTPTRSESEDNPKSSNDFNHAGYTNNAGTIVPAQWGSAATDAQGNTLQYTGQVARNGQLEDGPCVDLDGVNQYGVVADSSSLSFGDGSTDSPFSVAISFNADSFGAGKGALVSKSTKPSAGTIEFALVINDTGNISFFCYDDDGSVSIKSTLDAALSTSTAYEILATYDGSGSELGLTIYVDGEEPSQTRSENGPYVAMHANSQPIEIGSSIRQSPAFSRYFDGQLWNFRLWDSEVTPATMGNVDPIRHGPISEGSGTTSYDVSGNGKDITWQNSPSLSGTQDSYFHGESVGYSLYEHASKADILVPLKSDGTALTITPPSGYSKTGDYPAGPYHNNTQATLRGYLANSDSEADIYFGSSFNGSSSVINLGDIGNTTEAEFDLYVPNVTGTKALIQLASGDYLQLNAATLEANDIAGATFYVDGVAGTTISATTWQTVRVTYTTYDSTAVLIGNQSTSFLTGYVKNLKFKNASSDVAILPLYKDSLDRSSNCNHGTETDITYLNNPATEISALNPTIPGTETLAVTDGNKKLILLGAK